MKQITAFGTDFESVTDLCEYYGLSKSSVFAKLSKQQDIEDIVVELLSNSREPVYGGNVEKIPVSYKGKDYTSFNQACKDLGVPGRFSVIKRMQDGLTFEEAVDHYKDSIKKMKENKKQREEDKELKRLAKQITVNGITYKNCRTACLDLGLCESSVTKYMNKEGVTRKEAIIQLMQVKHPSASKEIETVDTEAENATTVESEEPATENILSANEENTSTENK